MSFDLSFGALVSAVGAAVLHVLWQGAVVGVLAAAALRGCRREAAQARYCVALAGLGACAVVFGVTFVMQLASHAPGGLGRVPLIVADGVSVAWWKWGGGLLRTETVSAAWCLGVGALTVRLCLQLAAARRLSRGSAGVGAPPERWVEAFERIKAQLGVHRAVRLLQHASIDTPMVVGWLAPVVLVPTGAFMSLTPDQLYAVLAHELAHIRRKDHLLNGAQAVVEVVLFFHPVVWWLSSRARVEREHCCDDVAVGAAASPLVFAEALARLETLRHVFPQAAVAANGGSLMERIERVLKIGKTANARSLRWGGVAAIAAGAVVVAAALAQVSPQPGSEPAAPSGNLLLLVKPTQVIAEVVDDDQPDDAGVVFRIVDAVPCSEEDDQGFNVDLPVELLLQLTQEQYDHMEQMHAAEQAAKDVAEQDRRKFADDLDAAVESGAITREEADKRLKELTVRTIELVHSARVVTVRSDRAVKRTALRVIEDERSELDKIEDAVAAGTMTRAEADDQVRTLQKKAAEREKREAAERATRK